MLPARATVRRTSRADSPPPRKPTATPTVRARSSWTNRPRRPLVPEVVTTRYRPQNGCPTSSGSATNASTFSWVTWRSVTQSSKRAISVFLSVTGSSAGSSTRSGRPAYSSR
ncbi:hypothetical protein C1J01_43195 [Nonomuraea aridisoli]|uniref:Uncharacterized protein n=1 Tax=Nonomuraea aridisoli TaxID=2070368 RepID=A0A2W2DX18_9ACTN|nr:hypothetical protein C1J01_43195 [Nonomuraea aridisoli]